MTTPGTIILQGVVGSHAYGLNHAQSDIDTAGVFVASLRDVLSLGGPIGTVCQNDGTDKDETPDFTLHEVGKFISLAAKNNPTAMEYLWLDSYLELHPAGQLLIEYRANFLTTNVRNSYGGYARQQLSRLKTTGDFGSDLKKRKAKNARHLTRLVIQGKGILETGELKVRLNEFDANLCRYMGDLCVENEAAFLECAELMLADIDMCQSDLPDSVNMTLMNELLYSIRMDYKWN